jgi:hypothetical protein
MRSLSHMGVGFEVWNRQQTWFWYVVNPQRSGGTIGAAANEVEAIREARWAIEEMSVPRLPGTAASVGVAIIAYDAAIELANSNQLAASRWDEMLANLACYLTEACGQLLQAGGSI